MECSTQTSLHGRSSGFLGLAAVLLDICPPSPFGNVMNILATRAPTPALPTFLLAYYLRTRSTTFIPQNHETGEHAGEPKVFEVDYGSGSVLGLEGKDRVEMAGLDLTGVIFGLVLYEDQQVKILAVFCKGCPGYGYLGTHLGTLEYPSTRTLKSTWCGIQ